jgi:hypothetical protein
MLAVWADLMQGLFWLCLALLAVCGCFPWVVHSIRWKVKDEFKFLRDWVGLLGFAALVMGTVWSSLELAEIHPEPFGLAIVFFMSVVVEYAWLSFNGWLDL